MVARTEDELVDALRSALGVGRRGDPLRAAFRARFCSLEDGARGRARRRRVWLELVGAASRR